jgi:hypothetical protein
VHKCLVESLEFFTIFNGVAEALQLTKHRNCVLVQLLYAFYTLATQGFLKVRKKETSEFWSLEKVSSLIILLRLCQNIYVLILRVFIFLLKFILKTCSAKARIACIAC